MNGGFVDRFLRTIEPTGLVPPDTINSLRDTLAKVQLDSERDVAAELVQQQLLTSYQAERLLAGDGAELVLAGRYQIREPLGTGGMGTVYLAQDLKLDRAVAIKVLPPESVRDPDALARFEREAKALAKIAHPGIIQVYDTGSDGQRHFLVMEYAEGQSVAGLARRRGPLSPAQAADIIYQAASSLKHAHQKGLVHRDVKPANLLFTPPGEVKLLDLGLARFLQDQIGDPTLTCEGMGMGTPDYMPPEQFRDARNVDARSDIYSLGCTLYQLLTGGVPFPGSSLTEKRTAHEKKGPLTIEEVCPEVPLGLVMIVNRMMAKRPVDRFQSMQEVAEALTPHVAGSSKSLPQIKQTASWKGGQLSLGPFKARSVARRWAATGGASVVLVLLGAVVGPMVWSPPPGANRELRVVATGPTSKQEAVAVEDNVITVAQDGTGQFRTIAEALDNAEPGMTIRVLDDATYRESVTIDAPERHAGIVLEAANQATIALPVGAPQGVLIRNVPRLVLRGFRICETQPKDLRYFVTVSGNVAGVKLQALDMDSKSHVTGIGISDVQIGPGESPLSIEQCTLTLGNSGLDLHSSSGIVIGNNRITGCLEGIQIKGAVNDTQITGNVIWNCGYSGLELEDLQPASKNILIANNTVFRCGTCLRIWDYDPYEEYVSGQIELCNNLFVEAGKADIVLLHSSRESDNPFAADGKHLLELWRFDNNWRDLSGVLAEEGIPVAPSDTKLDRPDVISRDASHDDFMRPLDDSPLAAGGAGNEDPSLPAYVGAVPPVGVDPWDWQKTWDTRHPKTLLTVSQDPKDGGEFRSISEALEKVNFGMTIRVLDDAVYQERLSIGSPSRHSGITLEAPRHATIEAVVAEGSGLRIAAVANVTVRGFRLQAAAAKLRLVSVEGPVPGLLLDQLETHPGSATDYDGIILEGINISSQEAPAVVQNCILRRPQNGIVVLALAIDYRTPSPCGRIVIRNNTIIDPASGITVKGAARQIHIVGNLVRGTPKWSAMQLENLLEGAGEILIANNTVFESTPAFRIWDETVRGENIEFRNNLILGAAQPDMVFLDSGGSQLEFRGPGDGKLVHENWQVSHNWREVTEPTGEGILEKSWIPPGAHDVRKDRIEGLCRDLDDPSFLRPPRDSPLAIGGAGNEDSSLPTYVGAVPPEGLESWDWEKTWEARHPK